LQFFQISTGLGAGNLGDEMMARAFWQHLPKDWNGEVEVFPMAEHYRGGYPQQHRYTSVHDKRYLEAAKSGITGLLACGTPVHEVEGLHFPMRFIAERLDAFHAAGTPVHAVGVGVDFLYTKQGRALFAKSFQLVQSWTVRNEACREALLDLGVAKDSIAVGADWAWLYEPADDKREWAANEWRSWGVDPQRPLLAVNIVNLVWRRKAGVKEAIAEALDRAHTELGMQIAFVSNECREGSAYDYEAAREVAAKMSAPATLVPNRYWSVDEMLGLLQHARVTLGMRYHFAVMTVLAGGTPVCLARSQKIKGLCSDLKIEPIPLRDVHSCAMFQQVRAAMSHRPLPNATRLLRDRAAANLSYLQTSPFVY